MKPHIFHPEAEEEYDQAVDHYSGIQPELGDRFFDEIEGLISQVCAAPLRFMRISPPARRALSKHFPYAVVYLDQPDRIWIVAVMHGARRPGYWKHRIREPHAPSAPREPE